MAESATTTTKSLIRRALPSPVFSVIQVFRRLAPSSRLGFARVWLRRIFTRAGPLPAGLPRTPRVLFVCHGNILRSAVAQALYTDRVRTGLAPLGSIAESAGTAAREGERADPRGVSAAKEMGIALDEHRAGRLSEERINRADLVEIIHIIAQQLKLTYTIDPEVKGTVTINSAEPLRSEDLLPIFHQVLRMNGAVAVRTGNLYHIMPIKDGKGLARPVGQSREDSFALQVVPVRFFAVAEMKRVLTPFLRPGGEIIEQGSHEELLARRGAYYELYRRQSLARQVESIERVERRS